MKKDFREMVGNGKKPLGTWIQMGSPEVVEMVGLQGFDFAVIDTEHTFFGTETAENLVRAADAVGLIPFIRVAHKDPALVMKALDTGAAGFVYPGVTTAEDAQEAVSSSMYPPEGTRGACPFVRASGHSSTDWKSFAQRSNRDLVRIILVEGTEGIENLSEIVSVEGVDVIMMGPFDLSVVLGVGGEVEHPAVMEKFAEIIEKCREHNVIMMPNIFNCDPAKIEELSDHWFSSGCQSLIVNTDKSMLSWALSENLRIARKAERAR
jgi:4-hydroxy-2-oxoheptanedioate aldolase